MTATAPADPGSPLLAERERPVRVKRFCLNGSDVRAIAERAVARRADAWLAAGVEARPC